jgi:DNA processing protein
MPEPADFAALSFLPSGWRIDIADRLRQAHHPADILAALAAERRFDARRIASVRARGLRAIRRAMQAGIATVTWADAAYPAMLMPIADPPAMLWVRGTLSALDQPAVAIVGARAASPYALAVAERLASDLAARGIAVVSGLARGVDSAAHRGALAAGATTIAVLGSGADVIYPPEHQQLATDILINGAIVSELAPGTRPLAFFFPMRNRIISGLSRAVVVIEAGERSGSLITARCALEQGRDVLAVPGNVLNGRNRGGHALLKDGAKIVETADDILEELGFGPAADGAAAPRPTPTADPVLAALLPGEACDLDAISERSGLSAARLLPRLCELELRGQVRRTGGGRFMRFDSPC